ncbi:WbuC family cupin fold metalloprotein [Marinomonas sp. 2405UD68-3]|uniref:WbuC family cupin fold metalloprotein n=1 Tax=Marinomonas sp. 2405UD68-3 TaxID=3391835 RepID=UPI0039C945A8
MKKLAAFNNSSSVVIDQSLLSWVLFKAKNSESKHFRYCLHHDTSSSVQEMVIAVTKDSLFPPHRHPINKSESIHLIHGEIATFIFDQLGHITNIYHLSNKNKHGLLQRVEGGVWHLPVCISDYAIYHEVLAGPYNKKQDVENAPWAPNTEDVINLKQYRDDLVSGLINYE